LDGVIKFFIVIIFGQLL